MTALLVVLLAILLFAGVGAIAVVHVLWGLGSHWPEESEEALVRGVVGDGRRRMPPPWQCFAVALVLAAIAIWPLYVVAGVPGALRAEQGSYAVAGLFLARGLAGFTPRWKEHFAAEPFATRNRRYYSPLCLLLGAGYVALVAGAISS